MQIKLVLDNLNEEISAANIQYMSFTSDIFSMYTTAKIILKDFALRYFNEIKIGTDISIIFYDDQLNKIYRNPMKITMFSKIPGEQSSFEDCLEINLIHSWYFSSILINKAYGAPSGKTISEIILEILHTHFPDEFSSEEIEITHDHPAVRYQLFEKCQDFLNRISKYAIIGQLPTYLYIDAKNQINFKGISTLVNRMPQYKMIPRNSNDINEGILKSQENTKIILMDNFRFHSDILSSYSSVINLFSTSLFKSNNNIIPGVTLSSPNILSDQYEGICPPKVNYKNWNLTPSDALAISVRDSFELNYSSSLSVNLNGIYLQEFLPGTLVRVILPYEPITSNKTGKKINIGEGNYLVQKTTFTFKGNSPLTKLKLLYISN